MGKLSPAVALPFNHLCDDAHKITRLTLVKESACLLSEHFADLMDEGRGYGGKDKEATIANMEDQKGNRREEKEMLRMEPEPMQHVASDAGTSSSVDETRKRTPSFSSEDASCSVAGDFDPEDPLASASGSSGELAPIEEQIKEKIPDAGGCLRGCIFSDCSPLWGHVSICGERPEIEDAVSIVPQFSEIPLQLLTAAQTGSLDSSSSQPIGHFFGVYDGHGGAQVANYCQERVHLALQEEMRNLQEASRAASEEDSRNQWERTFTRCFRKVDAEVDGRAGRGSDSSQQGTCLAPETVGSTAVVAVLCSTHIVVANSGDSRAVLCRGKQALPLSVDHKPNREDECARIEAADGRVIQWNGHRVFGVLAVSRSIGDRFLKPWIIPDPEVTLTARAKEDECLVLASDGLWDVISNEEACDAARRRILAWHRKNAAGVRAGGGGGADPAAQAAAEYLSRLALRRRSKDNITVVVVDLKPRRRFFKPSNP